MPHRISNSLKILGTQGYDRVSLVFEVLIVIQQKDGIRFYLEKITVYTFH